MNNKNKINETVEFNIKNDLLDQPRHIVITVYNALTEKGYNPINQLVGYILSGDPSYITAHNNARNLISKLERDELLEEIVKYYVSDQHVQ